MTTPLTVPLQPVPSQAVTATLAGQPCLINVYQKRSGLYLDLYVNGAVVIAGALARNAVKLVRDAYHGFIGDLAFFDTQGSSDPQETGLGSRWALVYLGLP